jgi:hypothetical protein
MNGQLACDLYATLPEARRTLERIEPVEAA